MWPGINELKSTSQASAPWLWRCQPCLSQCLGEVQLLSQAMEQGRQTPRHHPNHGMLPKPLARAAGNLQLSCPMALMTPRPEGRGLGGGRSRDKNGAQQE